MTVTGSEASVQALLSKLKAPSTSLSEKYRVLFSLRNLPGAASHAALLQGLEDESALFRHEVAYCLGQRCDPAAINTLSKIMNDVAEHPMHVYTTAATARRVWQFFEKKNIKVFTAYPLPIPPKHAYLWLTSKTCRVRHEAGEALGAIGSPECMAQLRKHQHDSCLEVAQTCQLAIQRIEFYSSHEGASYKDESKYLSVDPAPAYPSSKPLSELRTCLLDDSAEIFSRYRALFALRNLGSSEAIKALGESFHSMSALLKHEVAYVLGQIQDKQAVETLRRVLTDPQGEAMVRHEAAEALGSIADPICMDLLKQHVQDPEPIVADSCIVALDMMDHELSNSFQYAAGIDGDALAPCGLQEQAVQ